MYRRYVNSWEGDGYQFNIEDVDGYAFLHIEEWEPRLSTYRTARKLLPEMLKWIDDEGYDGLHGYTQNIKFNKLFPSFVHMDDVTDEDGEVWGVFKCHQQS